MSAYLGIVRTRGVGRSPSRVGFRYSTDDLVPHQVGTILTYFGFPLSPFSPWEFGWSDSLLSHLCPHFLSWSKWASPILGFPFEAPCPSFSCWSLLVWPVWVTGLGLTGTYRTPMIPSRAGDAMVFAQSSQNLLFWGPQPVL